ncbi:hypothetical protein V8C35DRAFT_298471 [Trichoderma chlorosporum]
MLPPLFACLLASLPNGQASWELWTGSFNRLTLTKKRIKTAKIPPLPLFVLLLLGFGGGSSLFLIQLSQQAMRTLNPQGRAQRNPWKLVRRACRSRSSPYRQLCFFPL